MEDRFEAQLVGGVVDREVHFPRTAWKRVGHVNHVPLFALFIERLMLDEIIVHDLLEGFRCGSRRCGAAGKVDEILVPNELVEGVLLEVVSLFELRIRIVLLDVLNDLAGNGFVLGRSDCHFGSQPRQALGHRMAGARLNHVRGGHRDLEPVNVAKLAPQGVQVE